MPSFSCHFYHRLWRHYDKPEAWVWEKRAEFGNKGQGMPAIDGANGSIRMEPVFMILGQSAATAAVMAIDGKMAVQDVPYAKLRERLSRDKQILEYTAATQR